MNDDKETPYEQQRIAYAGEHVIQACMQPIMFPMRDGPRIPLYLAQAVYTGYVKLYGDRLSLEKLAQNGGFCWGEVASILREVHTVDKRLHAHIMGITS